MLINIVIPTPHDAGEESLGGEVKQYNGFPGLVEIIKK